jgi:ribosomal protein S18 acetylase RimI-like enzyme
MEIRTHHERTIPASAVRDLYYHVGRTRPAREGDIRAALLAGPAVGAWDGDRLVGFARALCDGHFDAYLEDVMVHEDYRCQGVGRRVVSLLLEQLEEIETVSLYCRAEVVRFYESSGCQRTPYVLMQRIESSRTSENFSTTHSGE